MNSSVGALASKLVVFFNWVLIVTLLLVPFGDAIQLDFVTTDVATAIPAGTRGNTAARFLRMLTQALSPEPEVPESQPVLGIIVPRGITGRQLDLLKSSLSGRNSQLSSQGLSLNLGAFATGRSLKGRSLAARSQYCAVSKNHTACRYTEPNQDGHCGDVRQRGLTPRDVKYILKLHNDVRRTVALGKQRGQPPAANMAELIWDEEAASIAQLWADQCQFDQDINRKTVASSGGRPLHNGQNMYFGEGFAKLDFKIPIFEQWFQEEVDNFKASGVSPYGPRKDALHYVQLVWAETRRVGCGYVWHADEHLFFCNYAPGGNTRRSQPVYKRGNSCAACPRDRPECKNGLCAEN